MTRKTFNKEVRYELGGMNYFSNAMQMAQSYSKTQLLSIAEAFEILDKLVLTSWHVWITAENNRETLFKAKEIEQELGKIGVSNYNGRFFTIDIWENEEGYGYSTYPLGTEPDEDGDFPEDTLIDGGVIESDSLIFALEYIEKEIDKKEVA